MKHRLPLIFVGFFLIAIAWIGNPQRISKAVAPQGGTATEVKNETIKIDLSKTPTQFEQQVDVFRTANGIELLASKDQGYLISSEIKVPIDSPKPFLAVTAKWAAKIYDGGVSVSIRARSESGSWDDWIDLQDNDDSRLSANEYGGSLILLDKQTTYVQYRISIEKGEHSAPNSIVSEIGLTFISPGATSKELQDEIQSTVEGTQPQGNALAAFSKPAVISRTAWGCPDGANSPTWTPQYTTVTHLIIHHTDNANTSSDWPAVVRSIWSYHTNSNGWGDIGYNYLVDPNGNIYEGRAGGDNVIGAHFSCANTNTMGIAALGTFSSVSPTSNALTSMEKLLAWKSDQRGIDPLGTTFHSATQLNLKNISGHRDANPTTVPGTCPKDTECPGNNLYAQLPSIRNDVKNLISGGGQSPDLTITAGSQFVTPSSVAAGSSVTAGCSEDNSGTATAGANVVSLYLSTDAVLTPGSNGDTYLGFIQFSSVAANSNSPVNSKNIQIPSGTAPGTYFLYFWADGEQEVSESTEGNNFASRQLTVTGATIPTITTSVASLPSFGSVAIGQNSAPRSYTVSGSNLSANIALQAPTGFRISLNSTSGFTNTLNLTQSGGSVPTTTIYARFSPQTSGAQNGSISHASSGATTKNISVSGTGTSQCTYSISESEHTVSPGSSSVNFFMDAPSGCAWTAISNSQSWLTTSSSGSGDGTVSYNTAVNPSSTPRVGHITVGGQVHTVTQIGVGGAGNVRFSSVSYSSNEGGADATITVTRAGGTGTGSVQYSTSNGTATAGADYVSASGTLLFVGDETSKSFNVTILDDTTFEDNESFSLSLNNTSSSFTLGNPSTATLMIIDNDISPDSTGPGLSINSHSNGDTVSNSSISLSGTASDSGRGNNGISSVTVNGEGASGGTASGSGTANWSRSLTLSQGANNITVVARDNSSNQNSTTKSITLYYQPVQTYTIGVSASPSAGGTVGGDGTFAAGSSRTVTASANSDYSFANWTENGSVVSSSASYTFTLNGNRTLVANFSIVSSSNAAYDSMLKAPKCLVPGSVCDSGTLINGRGNITGGEEPNQPNTIYNSCADNTVGSYHSDESIDRVRISTLDGSSFAPGKTVKIEVTVWAFSVTEDFLDLFYAGDATNPNWTYITTLAPSITGAQVLSTTFTLPSGGSLQAVRANFLYQGALTPCSGGSDNYEDHDDLVFAVESSAPQSIQLLLEESGPSLSQAAAVDSMLLLRDPFRVVNEANLFNLGLDRNTRVIIFATNLQLTQGETSASVVVNLIDSSGLSYDIAAEDVRPVPNFNFTQVIFRLPNNLPVGTCTIKVKAHNQVSNAGTIRIRI